MGKNPNNSKIKAEKKKGKKLRLLAAQDAVKKANEVQDLLFDFSTFRIFVGNGIKAYVECRNVDDIDEETFQAIFHLERRNMKNLYDLCSWGWNEEKKLKEMTEKNAKYLIARNENKEIIGFSHFRFDMDHGHEVLYCYELQLDASVRRNGLGKFLLELLELIAFKNEMRKVVLTVLKHNVNAVNFFHSLKYEMDSTNPEEEVSKALPYMILSKLNKKFI